MTKIEHAYITVPDIDEAITFIQIVAPDFKVRKDQSPANSHRWAHIGNDECYFALMEAHIGAIPKTTSRSLRKLWCKPLGIGG